MEQAFVTTLRRRIRARLRSRKEKRRIHGHAALVKTLSDARPSARKLIVDCGFNRGLVAERLLAELPGFALVGFEVQQDTRHFADRLAKRMPEREIEVIYAAVGTHDGEIDYYEAGDWGKNYKGGTTTVPNKQSKAIQYAVPKRAPCVDFARWLLERVPETDAFVFVKMDIEGAEYDVIEHLLETRAIDRVDVLAVEWHAEKFPAPQRERYLGIERRIKAHADGRRLTVIDWY